MKTFHQLSEEISLNEANYKQVQQFVFDKLENSDMDVDQLEAAVIKKFGRSAKKHMEKAMSEYMD